MKDWIFRVDLFTITKLAKIPGEYGVGFDRMCVYNDRILVTNEHSLFFYDVEKNDFEEAKFLHEGRQVTMGDVTLYSFGYNAIVKLNDLLFYIKDDKLNFLYCAR